MILGITGGIGAGKSTVARWFGAWGASLVSADEGARAVVAPGEPGLAALAETLGPGILCCDGALDRAALARRMFADEAVRAAVEGVLHPLITAWVTQAFARQPHPIVYEAPLLFEAGHDRLVDAVCVVVASPALRLARVQARDQAAAAEIEARMAAQLSDEARATRADVILRNDGDLVALEAAARALWDDWTAGRPLLRGY